MTNPIMPHTPEWDEARKRLLTASKMPAIMGVSEYATPFEVAAEMLGMSKPFEGNEATRKGTRYEPAIIADYADTVDTAVVYPLPLAFHPELPFIGASPDAMWSDRSRLVEAKLTMSPRRATELGPEGTDWVPDDWMIQTQTQMDVCDMHVCDIPVLLYGRLRIYTVHRNESLIESIRQRAAQFWDMLQRGELPEPDWGHTSTPAFIRALYGVNEGEIVELSEKMAAAWDVQKDMGRQIEAMKEDRESIRAQILHAIGEAAIARLPGANWEIVRSQIKRKGYTVEPTNYVTMKERKVKT